MKGPKFNVSEDFRVKADQHGVFIIPPAIHVDGCNVSCQVYLTGREAALLAIRLGEAAKEFGIEPDTTPELLVHGSEGR